MDHDHDHKLHSPPRRAQDESFWKSRAAMVFFFFLAVAGFLLAYEHRAHILTGNGLLILLLVLCPVMHLFMHGGHGGHGGQEE